MRVATMNTMIRTVLGTSAALLTALVVVATGLGGPNATTTLRGAVGPGYTISLTKAGKKVKILKPGTYVIVVSDRSPLHDFLLQGPTGRPRQLTTVGFTGTETVTVKLKKGTWTYFCARHASQIIGRFGVGGPAHVQATPNSPEFD
ncbi:MAG: hypothetical protein QOH95_1644 [Gaiellaceae bacterium]|jgi:plastocyanin|nr:hypothetical protein [Gaiellaceae bacterium]